MYNPFSTFNSLSDKRFTNYWFETGTPTFLIDLIGKKRFNIEKIPAKAEDEYFDWIEEKKG